MHLLTRRPVIVALLLPLIAPLAGIVWVFWMFSVKPAWEDYTHRLPFDSATWKARTADDGTRWPTRLRMADDLLASGVLAGKTRSQVTALLGRDDDSGDAVRSGLWFYLGPGRDAFGFDQETLAIRFGADGRVVNARIDVAD
jgi:hypothetical protein